MVILWQSVTCILLKKTSFEVRFEAFLTGRRVAVFWKNGMKNFFNFWAKWVQYPNGIRIPRGPKKGDCWFIDCSRNGTNLDSEEKSNRVSTKSRNKSRIESVTSRLKHQKKLECTYSLSALIESWSAAAGSRLGSEFSRFSIRVIGLSSSSVRPPMIVGSPAIRMSLKNILFEWKREKSHLEFWRPLRGGWLGFLFLLLVLPPRTSRWPSGGFIILFHFW